MTIEVSEFQLDDIVWGRGCTDDEFIKWISICDGADYNDVQRVGIVNAFLTTLKLQVGSTFDREDGKGRIWIMVPDQFSEKDMAIIFGGKTNE